MSATPDENENKKRAKEAIEKYFSQLTKGCGRSNCPNPNCASHANFKPMSTNEAAAKAMELAKSKAVLCDANKQSKVSPSPLLLGIASNSSAATPPPPVTASTSSNIDDNDDIIYTIRNIRSASGGGGGGGGASASSSSTSDLKSLDEALKDAVKYVTKINEKTKSTSESSDLTKSDIYLSEHRVLTLIKKCKNEASETHHHHQAMEVDNTDTSSLPSDSHLPQSYAPLINLVERVFQSYEYLSQSFTFKETTSTSSSSSTSMSSTMPSMPPFNIDFNAIRRAYSQLFSIGNERVIDELEKRLNLSIKTLCFSIRMILKKADTTSEPELVKIMHALLVVNELPMLEDPKYMDECARVFYATFSELPNQASAKIIRLWSRWTSDELKIFLDKLQQYITVCIISKNMDDEAATRHNNNNDDDDDDDEDPMSDKNCLHNNEGISGAVGCLKLIYYASVLGGRLDSDEQIKRERTLESDEVTFFESILAHEEPSIFGEMGSSIGGGGGGGNNTNSLTSRLDPLEEILNVRLIDCREPKIPHDQFINEVANKHIDIQHDYVEYIQQLQLQEHQRILNGNNAANSRAMIAGATQSSKKNIFSFLNNPFFLTLSKKNLGLYYDNKIKMMRERRNNIMMSLLEGSMPNPYFKMRLSRQNLLVDALSLIELQEQENPAILRKQLFIEFENEQGIDQGGVSKEFFQLAIDELLNKGYTFFKYDEQTKYYWFTPCTIETEKEFRLIGILFGIAIYNSVLLDVQFPPVFFRKLMGKLGTFEDLFYSHPELYQSLVSLLEFKGTNEEFEDTFMMTFQISLTDHFDTVVSFNLKENGDKIAVNKENRREFVDLYADFILNKGIDESFKAFRRGFMKTVMNSPLAKWYSPEELEILLCGTKVMDWKNLENSTSYDSGFESTHPYIKHFWSVFEEFTVEEKMLFLKFTTGTDRCPHGGLSELKLTIARNGPDTEKLPTAHTCFNVLLLPEYSSRQRLKEKLLKAIQYSRGFGLS